MTLLLPTALDSIVDVGADHRAYVDHVVAFLEGLRLDGLRIVLDAANGAAYRIGPEVLRAAGAEVIVIAESPNGRNINDGVRSNGSLARSLPLWSSTAQMSVSRSTVMPIG